MVNAIEMLTSVQISTGGFYVLEKILSLSLLINKMFTQVYHLNSQSIILEQSHTILADFSNTPADCHQDFGPSSIHFHAGLNRLIAIRDKRSQLAT